VASLFALAATFSIHEIINFDIWMHLRTGRVILENMALPRQDIFSFTAAGRPWVIHEYLSQVLFSLVHASLGVSGLVLFKLAIVLAMVDFMRRTSHPREGGVIIFTLLGWLAVNAAHVRFLVRPFLWTDLLAIVYLYILREHQLGRKHILWSLPPLQALWSNLHGGAITGIAMVALFFAGEVAARRWGVVDARERDSGTGRRLALVFAACLAACCLNPHGADILAQPFRQVGSGAFRTMVYEWLPLFEYAPYPKECEQALRALIFLSAASFLWAWRRPNPPALLVYMALLFMSLGARRHITLFSMVAVPVACWNFRAPPPPWVESTRMWMHTRFPLSRQAGRWMPGILVFCLLFLSVARIADVANDRYYVRNRLPERFGLGVSGLQYPGGAVDFIDDEGISGRGFNNYRLGGYLIWRHYPERPVFIDGRNLVYGSEFFIRYEASLFDMEAWEALAGEYDVDYAVLDYRDQGVRRLIHHLVRHPDWAWVYFDSKSVIFVRRMPGREAMIRRSEIGPERLGSAIDSAPGPDRPGDYPYELTGLADLASAMGALDEAERAYRRALTHSSDFPELHHGLGLILEWQGRGEEAEPLYARAAALNPGYAEVRLKLGEAAERRDEMDLAVAEYRAAIRRNPRLAEAHYRLGGMYARRGEDALAVRELKRAIETNPFMARSYNDLGTLYLRQKRLEKARKAYGEALRLNPRIWEARYNLALTFIRERRYDEAISELKKAIAIDPSRAPAYSDLGLCYAQKGLFDKARRSWERALEIDPEYPQAVENLSRLGGV